MIQRLPSDVQKALFEEFAGNSLLYKDFMTDKFLATMRLTDLDKKFNKLDYFQSAFPDVAFPKTASEPPPLISGEQKSNGGLVHPHLKGFDEPKQVSDTRLLEGLLTVLSFTLFSPGHAVRFPKLSARQRLKPMPIGR